MNNIKPIAIYLPQFHSIPENDEAWGFGFTDWINVKKAYPLFDGHYQPHIPHESIGYYNLSDPEILTKQASLAKANGIYGFAFYHYWFNGKRLLNIPIDNMLRTGNPDFPFCLIWANENWTKRWDGQDKEIIIKQEYSFNDDQKHIRFLCENIFSDKRYITIDSKPVFIVYRTELFPDIIKTVRLWREEAKLFGFKDLYLIRVESITSDIEPSSIGFDSAMEFGPDWRMVNYGIKHTSPDFDITKFDYTSTVFNTLLKNKKYKYFRCVFPQWDNSSRRKQNAVVFVNSSPFLFKYFLYRSIQITLKNFIKDEQLLFINAWNEWGEGCHIEPDKRFGFQYLHFCNEAINCNYTNSEQEYMFFELLEGVIENLQKNNQLLDQKVNDLSQKADRILMTNDFKIGNWIMKPYRVLRQYFKKL
jgi:hypothetical protein